MRILPLAAIKLIERAVDTLFDRAKARYLGPSSLPKRIYLGFRSEFSLPGIFYSAAREERAIPDQKIMQALIQNAGNYLDSYRAATKAQVVKKVQAFLQQAELSGVKTDVETVLGGQLADVWAKATNDVKRMIDTEATGARNMGTLEGIIGVNANQGIEDPVVFFVVVRDQHLCDECKRLHLLDDEVTPRAWYLSELGHGYHKKGDDNPKVSGLHPHCRCTMVTLMPGYGFDAGGMIKFKGVDHNEIDRQRSFGKNVLEKSLPIGIETYKRLKPIIRRNAEGWAVPGAYHLPGYLEAFKTAPITVNFPEDALAGLHRLGRFKNLFETGRRLTGLGGGETGKDIRADEEERVFGIPHSIGEYDDFGHRPVYGALHFLHQSPAHYVAGAAPNYGSMWVKLRPHVHSRTTFTPRDSFESGPEDVFDHEGIEALAHKYYSDHNEDWLKSHFYGAPIKSPGLTQYVEAHIHGGVDLRNDVDELHIGPDATRFRLDKQAWHDAAKKLGRKYGFKVIAHVTKNPDAAVASIRPGASTEEINQLRHEASMNRYDTNDEVVYDPAWVAGKPKPGVPAGPAAPRASRSASAPGAGTRTSPRLPKLPSRSSGRSPGPGR